MSFIKKWKGKNVKINTKKPSAIGVCDESGFEFNHQDLHKQMEWRGDNLVWTGLMVGPNYLDKPNQQNRPPITRSDPKPIKNPRIPTENYTAEGSNPILPYKALEDKLNNTKW